MKNNSNSLINKFADIHSELTKLNKRVSNSEVNNEKTKELLKEEIANRHAFEKNIFNQFEQYNGKLFSLKKAYEDINNNLNSKIDSLKNINESNLKSNNDNILKNIDEKLNRIEKLEEKTSIMNLELTNNNDIINKNIYKNNEKLSEDINKIKEDVEKKYSEVNLLEDKFLKFKYLVSDDIKEINKNFIIIKNDVDLLQSFKEGATNNFKDITEEFLNKDKEIEDSRVKLLAYIKDNDIKFKANTSSINSQLEHLEIIKNDINKMIYDNNLSLNSRLQLINEGLIEKFEDYDRIIAKFQDNILLENSKFTDFISEQMNKQSNNTKKIIDYTNSDVSLLKEKSNTLESMIKTLRNEVFNNLNEIDEFFSKKYEYIFKIVNTTNTKNYNSVTNYSNNLSYVKSP